VGVVSAPAGEDGAPFEDDPAVRLLLLEALELLGDDDGRPCSHKARRAT
jgi:hypothetical protein